jgi:4-hydroxy-4-methyl-2-oxoglutarate aldolase
LDRSNHLATGLEGSTAALVSDALDRLGLRQQAMTPGLTPLAEGMKVVGRAVPVVVRATDHLPADAYVTERAAVEALAPGDVPVFSVPAGVTAAIWGELFSNAAIGRGAAGVVVDGYVRDVRQIVALDFPVFCRGYSLLDTWGRAEVAEFGVPAECGGVLVSPGDVIVGDVDGVVVVPAEAVGDVVAAVSSKARDEQGALADLLSGQGIEAVWAKWKVL